MMADDVGTPKAGRSENAAKPESVITDIGAILDTVDVPIVVVDRDCQIARINQAATAALSLTPSDIGRLPCNIRALAEVKDFEKLCAQVIADGVPSQREIRKGDRWFVVRVAPHTGSDRQVTGVVLTFTNVTAFRESLARAIYEREHTKAILNTVIEPLVVLDSDLRVRTANRAFYAMFGVSREETQGVPLYNLGDHEWRTAGMWSLLRASLSNHREFPTTEFERDFPLVGRRTVVLDARRVSQDGEAKSMMLLAFRDITERQRALEQARDAEQKAETANRAKDEFLAVLSHELRSPLNAMLGWVQVLKRAGSADELVGRAVETLERNIWAQSQVINDLLDISRITSGKLALERSRVDLAAVVAGVVDSMRPMAEGQHLVLLLTISHERLEVDGDGARLQQALGNLVHNAIKFTPEGGTVSVRATNDHGDVIIVVEDTGQGIESNLLPRIFDRFVQSEASTTRRHGGLGLGLAIVKQLVSLHGGSVQAESSGLGRGARFTVRLPLALPLAREVEAIRGDVPKAERADIRALDVLLVEDDADSREALAIAIEQTGAHVRLAASARLALEKYNARPPDILVSDIGLPGEDGYALIRTIREREEGSSRRTLAIAMTGFASRQDHETALRAGFDEHVGKPVEPRELLDRMRVLAAARGSVAGGRHGRRTE